MFLTLNFLAFVTPVDARPEAIIVGTTLLLLAALLRRGLRQRTQSAQK